MASSESAKERFDPEIIHLRREAANKTVMQRNPYVTVEPLKITRLTALHNPHFYQLLDHLRESEPWSFVLFVEFLKICFKQLLEILISERIDVCGMSDQQFADSAFKEGSYRQKPCKEQPCIETTNGLLTHLLHTWCD